MAPPNSKIQRTGLRILCKCVTILPAADLGVRSILNGWVGTKLDELPPQSKKYLDGYHRKMNPHHEAMVRLDYHGAQ